MSLWLVTAQATDIIIANLDSGNEGFNDTSIVSPVGGNPGTTLGEQRLNVFEHAAKIWESIIDSDITIVVEALFDPLYCTSTQAVLGSAGTNTVHMNFFRAPIRNTWYSAALSNSLASSDLDTNTADITAQFNSSIDNNNGCLNNTNWYYGLDGNRPAGTIELLTVVLHEIGHGLGFQTFVNLSNGARFNNRNDAYMLNLEDHSRGQTWNQLTDAQRLASSIDTADLHWVGPRVTALTGDYSGGVNQGHIRMYAPDPVRSGSSVSHFSNTLSPNELMEPYDTGPKSGPGLALPLLQDIGWAVFADAAPVISILGDQSAIDGETIQVDFLVSDNDTPLADLILDASSSNSAIVDASGLVFTGSGKTRTLNITPLIGSGGTATIDVTVSDATASASEAFSLNVVLNNPPVITVIDPPAGSEFLDTDSVSLQANATDTEDGDVTASLTWSSSLDGVLGSGGNVVTTLSEGVHTLTITASDSLGKTGTENLTVAVYGNGDSDMDSLNDNWEFSSFGSLDETATGDFDTDGLSNLDEFTAGTVPTNSDTDGDGVSDGDEVHLYGIDPNTSNKGDLGPRGGPDNQVNVGDMVVMSRLVSGVIQPTAIESILADMNDDGQLNVADMLLLQKAVLSVGAL